MTLRQLHQFATVARLGSVKAAARELGVSEPAVSAAVSALRRELGDDLYARAGHALVLTAGGERLASLADEICGLADRARVSLDDTRPAGVRVLHVAVTSAVEEHAAPALLAAFCDRTPDVEASVEVEPAGRFAELLDRRRADITLGPRPSLAAAEDVVAVPFLRYRMIVVAGRGHRLAGCADIAPAELAGERWMVGPGGIERSEPAGEYFARSRIAPADVRAFPSDAAALAAVAAGDGVMLALWHAATPGLGRRELCRLDVRGTPVAGRWYASTLGEGHCLTGALELRRFATSRDATHAMASLGRGVPAARVRPPVHATLWSSVAER
ncbi:MAG: LysR family transcriptional regulator [Solirubrobacteraceae bacterium]